MNPSCYRRDAGGGSRKPSREMDREIRLHSQTQHATTSCTYTEYGGIVMIMYKNGRWDGVACVRWVARSGATAS